MQRRALQRQRTACRVHQILEAERRAKQQASPNGGRDVSHPIPEENLAPGDVGVINHAEAETEAHVRSRMLTKKQLSDMAYGVRQLSKKLGSLRLRLNVKTVLLLTKIHDEEVIRKSSGLTEWLLSKEREAPYIVYVCFQWLERNLD